MDAVQHIETVLAKAFVGKRVGTLGSLLDTDRQLLGLELEQAIAAGLGRFDAGAQGEHKLIRGFEPVLTRSWHYLQHPGLRAAVADFLVQERAGGLASPGAG